MNKRMRKKKGIILCSWFGCAALATHSHGPLYGIKKQPDWYACDHHAERARSLDWD